MNLELRSQAPLVGLPRFGRNNPFEPGGALPGLSNSYLARLGRARQPETPHFGLADHIAVPISQLETQLTSSLTSTVEGLFSRARSLKSAAETLVSGTPDGVFDRRLARSSDAAVSAEARSGATVSQYAFDVQQLAVAQQNAGTQLLSSLAPSDIAAGAHTLQITVGATSTAVAVNVGALDTNLQALTSVRDAVNAAGAGVEATIVTTDDVSQLVLTANRTGSSGAFSVTDTTGSIVATTGTGSATRSATDALVRVNGVEQTLQENKLALDVPDGSTQGRVTAFFHAITQQTARVDVDVALDAGAVVAATERLTAAVNDVRAYVSDKPGMLSPGLLDRLNVAMDGLRSALASIGIDATESGTLSVNGARLRESLDRRPGDVERTIGSIQGFAARERAVAETLLENTSLAFATRPGPLGATYGRFLQDTARLHHYMLGGLFVDVFA